MRKPAQTQPSGSPDPFEEMSDRFLSVDVHGVFINSAVEAAGIILGDTAETLPEDIAKHLTVETTQDVVIIGFTEEGADAAFQHEYGDLGVAGAGTLSMAERYLATLASGLAAQSLSRTALG